MVVLKLRLLKYQIFNQSQGLEVVRLVRTSMSQATQKGRIYLDRRNSMVQVDKQINQRNYNIIMEHDFHKYSELSYLIFSVLVQI